MPDLKVLTTTRSGGLALGISRPPQYVEGIDALVQIVAVALLNNGGRSIFAPGYSGGLRQLLGQNYDPEDPAELLADIRLVLGQTERLIKEGQVRSNRPPSERLQSLQLVDITPSDDDLSIEVTILVTSEDQETSQAVVVS